ETSEHRVLTNATSQYGECDPRKSIAAQIPAVACSCARPMKPVDLSYGCSRVCGKRTAGEHAGNAFMKGVAGTATTPEIGTGIIKSLFYLGLHATGVLPDWDKLQVCASTYDFIHSKCPHRKQKGCVWRDQFAATSHRCINLWESLGRNNGEYVCHVVDWWDACCSDREPLPPEELDCAGCGQDMYFCQCSAIGDGLRPTHL
ncbi:unnamed protein product, partial [Symbiodinium natans]